LGSHQIIQECIEKTHSNIEIATKAFSSLSLQQLNWKIHPDSWSIGECLSHLINSNNLYLNNIQLILNSHPSEIEREFPYKQSFFGKMITKTVDPVNVKKSKTFKALFPDSSDINKSIIDDYVKSSETLIALAEKMRRIDLKKIKLSSPVNFLIRLNLGDPLIIIPKHDERHLNQADSVKYNKYYPKS